MIIDNKLKIKLNNEKYFKNSYLLILINLNNKIYSIKV